MVGGVYNILPNAYLADLQRKNMQKIGGIKYTGEERAFAEALRRTMLDPVLWIGGISCLIRCEASGSDRRRPPCVPFHGF